jgi:cysteine synthase A
VTSLLDAVGRTPLAELRRLVPVGRARVLVKLESHNPTGSMKDRMALAVVRGAASSCRLPPGGTVVEYTGGSTGTSLAFVCAALGHPITLVTSDAFSREKRDHMRALGATVVELPSEGGRTTRELIRRMIARAAELAGVPGAFYVDQFNNPDAAKGWYPGVADEVLRVSTAEATDMARRLAREEALFGGTSSGANVVAALRVAERLGPDRSVGTLVCDSGLKYLSTDLYSSRA